MTTSLIKVTACCQGLNYSIYIELCEYVLHIMTNIYMYFCCPTFREDPPSFIVIYLNCLIHGIARDGVFAVVVSYQNGLLWSRIQLLKWYIYDELHCTRIVNYY